MTEEITESIAKKFSELLTDEVGRFKVCRINRGNKREIIRNTGICHSHDYCDANEIMFDAAWSLGIDATDHENSEIINNAWDMAKRNLFYL